MPFVSRLSMDKRQSIIGLLRPRWPERRIVRETGFHRATIRRVARELAAEPQITPLRLSSKTSTAPPGDHDLRRSLRDANPRSTVITADELVCALPRLRLGGVADALSIRFRQARADSLGPFDFYRATRSRRPATAARPIHRATRQSRRLSRSTNARCLDWKFNALDRALIFELANCCRRRDKTDPVWPF